MPTLHISRIRLIAVETFKILHKMSPVYLQDLLSYKNSIYSFRYDNLVDVPRVRTTKYGKSSFCYEAAGVWNSLPNDLRKLKILRNLGGWSTHGAALRASVQCAKVNQFYFAFAYIKNSKWVWSGNTTITNCRLPRGTARKSRTTIMRHQEDKLSKAISSLFPVKMIAILEWT